MLCRSKVLWGDFPTDRSKIVSPANDLKGKRRGPLPGGNPFPQKAPKGLAWKKISLNKPKEGFKGGLFLKGMVRGGGGLPGFFLGDRE